MDEADQSDDHIIASLAESIASVRRRPTMKPTGICLNCEEILNGGRLFCSSECGEDFEVRIRKSRRNSLFSD